MNYWERRQQQLNSQLEKDEAKLKKRLSSFYDSEYRKLEKEIASYYQKYGENNVIQYRKLMESLPEEDKRLLIERMEEFADKYPQYEDMLPVRESIYKLNRLEGLQMSIRLQQIEIGAVDNTQLQEHLEKQAVRGANAAAETLGFGKNFYGVDSAVVKSVVNMAWANGENFSISIWKNTNKLANYLCTDIAQAIARGDSYDKVAKNMKKRFGDVSRNDMYRLIYTEGTYVMAESTMQPFTEDFEKYQISTVGDGKVCSICSGVAHEIFEIKDRKPGVNFPPFHPWCRCTFIIVVDDWDKWMDGYEKKHGNGQAELNDPSKIVHRSTNKNVALNRDGKEISFNFDKMFDSSKKYFNLERATKNANDIKEKITVLSNQYNTYLTGVKVGGSTIHAAGYVDIDGMMILSNSKPQTFIHEFAHSIASHDRVKLGLASESEIAFEKELAKLFSEYKDAVNGNPKKGIKGDYRKSISAYSLQDKEEFFAEAFAHYKMREFGYDMSKVIEYRNDYTYSSKVVDLVDRYFKKTPLENSANRGKISMNLQHFAKIPEEKFIDYALNPIKSPEKAKAFQDALGYNSDNCDDLIKNIKEHIDESKFVEKGDNGYGMRYEYVMNITGANGKSANVLTAWIQDGEEKRLTSVYVTNKKVTE